MSPEWSENEKQKSVDTRLNDGMTVSFEVAGYASIHYHPKADLPGKEKLRLFESGLTELAKLLEGRTDIHHVAATSWIVSDNPDFFTRKRKFFLVEESASPDVAKLVAEYWRRSRETEMVPLEHQSKNPKVALLRIEDLMPRLNK